MMFSAPLGRLYDFYRGVFLKLRFQFRAQMVQQLLESAERVFAASKNAKDAAKEKQQQQAEIENLYSQVGRLTTQLEWLKKKSKGILPRQGS